MISSLRLTRELVDQVVFGMENQERRYWLDAQEASVIPDEAREEQSAEGRYIAVPEWRSVDGYNLMEQFVGTLNNPIYRSRLRAILASGKGVFRQFKDTIRERREIERLWFTFKERRMREIVTDWFNDLREREGLERLAFVEMETETSILIESDFVFRPAAADERGEIRRLDKDAFCEVYDTFDPGIVELLYEDNRAGVPAPEAPESTVYFVETQGGDFAGFLWSVTRRSESRSVAFVVQLAILPEFRGFGLARALFRRYCLDAQEEGAAHVQLPLHGLSIELAESFSRYGLERRSLVLGADLGRWRRAMDE